VPATIQIRDIFNALGDGLFVANAEGRYIDINPAACQMLGYAKDELLGLTLLDVLDPSEAARLDETRREMSDLQIHRSEWLFKRKDGSVFVGELVGGQLPDGNLQSIVRDVSERLEREALERTLRQEAAHRTKNVLAVVQAILRQSSRLDPEHFVAKFEDRIKGLAASHDLFVRDTWAQVELKDLIEAQLKPFSFEVRERLTLDGPLVFLSPAAAQTLGLAIHELATNSAKYGSLSTDAGSLAVTWTLETSAPDGMFRLRWVESGGPPVRTPERTGFGTRLIDGLTKRSLLAQVSAQYEISGFKWELECPQSRLAIS